MPEASGYRLTDPKILAIAPPETGQDEYPDALAPGLRLRVGASGKKVWYLRTRANGKPVNLKLGVYPVMSLVKARDAARDKLKEVAAGNFRPARKFGDVAADFITRHAEKNNRTWAEQQAQLDRHVLPDWRDRDIETIRKRDVIELLDKLADTGKGTTANRVRSLLHKLFGWAAARDIIETNPVSGVGKPAKETARDRVLTDGEIAALWTAAGNLGYPFGHLAKLLLLTGQRLREVAGMEWGSVDLERGEWSLTADETKAARKHLVPLSSIAVALLSKTPKLGDPVLTTTGKTPVSGFSKSKDRLDALMAAEMEIPVDKLVHWTFHDLRRTASTGMTRLGIARFIVSRVLNHAEQGVTGQHYDMYDYQAEKAKALEAWAGRVAVIVGEAQAAENVVQIKDRA